MKEKVYLLMRDYYGDIVIEAFHEDENILMEYARFHKNELGKILIKKIKLKDLPPKYLYTKRLMKFGNGYIREEDYSFLSSQDKILKEGIINARETLINLPSKFDVGGYRKSLSKVIKLLNEILDDKDYSTPIKVLNEMGE